MPGFRGLFVDGGGELEAAALSRVFNHRRPHRRPSAVLRAADADDVVAGVKLARERGWQVAVRSGGHSWAGWSLREDTLLIDLAEFTGISYDEATGVVSAGPAVRGGMDLDPLLAERGRFFAGGHCPTVGLGGFLLQGGMGWNCRGWGWAAESVAAIDVVTAAGEHLRCDAEHNADLYWAARGSGPGFFGVVTGFHLRTRERFSHLIESLLVYPASRTREVLTWLHTARHEIGGSVELVAVGADLDVGDAGFSGPAILVNGLSLADGLETAERHLAPIAACPVPGALLRTGPRAADMAELRAMQVRMNPEEHRYTVDNAYLAGGTADVVDRLAPAYSDRPTAKTFSLWFDLAGLPERDLPDMALSMQSDLYFATYSVGENPDEDEACARWTNDTMRRLEPVSAGSYLGDSDLLRRPVKFMSDENLARLRNIRAEWDPEHLFGWYLSAAEVPLNTNPWEAR